MWRRVLVVSVLAIAAGAVAASDGFGAAMSLNISGRDKVRSAERPTVTVRAQTFGGIRLAVYSAPGQCASRLEDELGHETAAQLLQRWITHPFVGRIQLPAAARGSHHVCAYLYHRHYDNLITDVRASFHYVAR